MKKKKIVGIALRMSIAALMSIALLAGCGKDAAGAQTPEEAPGNAAESGVGSAAPDASEGEGAAPEGSGASVSESPAGQAASEASGAGQDAGQAEANASLAKRLCGKYSTLQGGEYLGLEIVSFGNNLYAHAGYHFAEEGEPEPDAFSYYSYWCWEWIPEDPAVLESDTADSVEVYELVFSNMANAGHYQEVPVKGTITLSEDGIVLEGFGRGREELQPDERAEDAFPYAREAELQSAGDRALEFYRSTGQEEPLYLALGDGSMYLYRKSFDREVAFYGGSCEDSGSSFSSKLSVLGSGGMPIPFSADYERDGDRLLIRPGDSELPLLKEETELVKIAAADLPCICADTSMRYVPGRTRAADLLEPDPLQDAFYGIFLSAEKDRERAETNCRKALEEGFEASVIYTPEWEGLSRDPYYSVIAGRYATREAAEEALPAAQEIYADAYVKYSGQCSGTHMTYTNYGMALFAPENGYVLLKYLQMEPTYEWIPYTAETEEDSFVRLWIVDEDTVFAPDAEMEFFGNYEEGDSPLDWILRNVELMETDSEQYYANGPALEGVFEVVVTGNHIDAFLGSYWWD